MKERFEKYGLELAGEKIKILEFGRYAACKRAERVQTVSKADYMVSHSSMLTGEVRSVAITMRHFSMDC